ncbi:hypothetical protein TNCV_1164471 [Trichonephila clavipes]|nr:hypothetical protein TNCV_1164471 [Trichonephila clavipes]
MSKLSVCVPLELSEKNLMDKISICSSKLARHKRVWDHLVTGDEKWFLQNFLGGHEYINYKGVQMAEEEYYVPPKQMTSFPGD